MSDIRIVFMGTPEFAVTSLKKLINNKYNIAGVVTSADKPSGRGQKVNVSPVKKFVLEENHSKECSKDPIPILQPLSLKDPEFLSNLEALNADLFIVVAFRVLPKAVWAMPRLGTFNLHGSLLPKYRGAAPINQAIIDGEKISGVTTFLLDEKIDTGSILFREKCEILEDDNVGSLYDKLMHIGSCLVTKTVDALASGCVTPIPQTEFSDVELSPAPKINRDTRIIKWENTAEKIHNLVRGLSPYPCAFTSLEISGKVYEAKIYGTKLVNNPSKGVGAVDTDGKSYFSIGCIDSQLEITELQLSGKKRMGVKDFLAGLQKQPISVPSYTEL